MSNEVKRINIHEFINKGYLQELNRQFLHPLGLALEVVQEKDGSRSLGGIRDYREDKEGIYFDFKNRDSLKIEDAKKKAEFVALEFNSRRQSREEELGFFVEKIPGFDY